MVFVEVSVEMWRVAMVVDLELVEMAVDPEIYGGVGGRGDCILVLFCKPSPTSTRAPSMAPSPSLPHEH